MKSNFHLVGDFHAKYGYGVDCTDEELQRTLPIRGRILEEEVRETAEAVDEFLNASTPQERKATKAHLAKEYIDMLYVVYGSLQALGVDADAAFAEVHSSNMSKTPGNGTNSNKPTKGPDYFEANMEQFV
ncbi:MAG: hypothetical protein DI628_02345 [Blastochloris viridis]|uniref:Phosphoribosyl-ATP pyrophosphohydrolase n=1 Tax=Blastochloris viridis TaxID=1079 RepID=A0A6N4RBS2_BLAVI|nr:MAG: hypothetical protein DI628_02345 [Blastochloris viridis]